ncbi:hypothetical protein O1Q96_27405 [Streptomyces sp. Qhu-G9]|uniref:MmyB family transcriptional regulator n=1 Tax=Streptomyces sp. Qhu-G9 TaxID=3452799 RepID=UPI0022ABFC88|nr:hypothetical protein [Streptomyces aurantiacus]WAU86423.1 hypothetical protein O1Q96_27405 [Streptomyces aurantiacus]
MFGNGPALDVMYPLQHAAGRAAFEASIVADLKDAMPRYSQDAQLERLVQELRHASDAFAHHWDRPHPAHRQPQHRELQADRKI